MSDNTQLNPGVGGDIAAADDIGGVKYQRVKLVLGDDGVAEGDVSSNRAMPVSGPLTQAQLTAQNVPVSLSDVLVAINRLLDVIANPVQVDPTSGRMRVMLDATGGAQTLATVTKLTSMSQVGGVAANSFIYDTMHAQWASALRGRIT